jgi:hypothetical protein
MSPLLEDAKALQNKDLSNAESPLDRKTDSENPNQAQNQTENLPPDLAEIVAVWPGLPGHIKAAIKALIRTAKE